MEDNGPEEQTVTVSITADVSGFSRAFERAMGGHPKVRRGSTSSLTTAWKPIKTDAQLRLRAVARAAEMVGDAIRLRMEAYRNVQKFLINNGLIEPPPPEDKWERALWMRDHRNTGPPTPAAWHRRDTAPTKARARRARGPVNQRRRRSYEFHS